MKSTTGILKSLEHPTPPQTSKIQAQHIRTVNKSRATRFIGMVGETDLELMNQAIKLYLRLYRPNRQGYLRVMLEFQKVNPTPCLVASSSQTKGRYEIDGDTLTFTTSDGRVSRMFFGVPDAKKNPKNPDWIYFGGRLYGS